MRKVKTNISIQKRKIIFTLREYFFCYLASIKSKIDMRTLVCSEI